MSPCKIHTSGPEDNLRAAQSQWESAAGACSSPVHGCVGPNRDIVRSGSGGKETAEELRFGFLQNLQDASAVVG
jgi:hypothetical protein